MLVLVLVVFTALGRGVLAGPPLAEPAAWEAWAGRREPAVVLFALLRLIVVGLGWYLLAVSLIGVAARVVRARRLVVMADLVTVPVVRRMLQGAVGVSLATTSLATVGTPAMASEQPPNVVEIHDDNEETDPEWWRITADEIRGGSVAPAPPTATEPMATSQAVATPAEVTTGPTGEPWVTRDAEPQPAVTQQRPSGQWQVRAGEHFWSIAERVVGESQGREPSEDEVQTYWLALVRENRAGLADPGNPDLIYPGQVITLPALPGASAG